MKKSDKTEQGANKRRRRQDDTIADWAAADHELLGGVVAAVTANGGAIRFGYSRDGGAYALGIYGDGKPFTEYLGATADVNEWLAGIKFDYE